MTRIISSLLAAIGLSIILYGCSSSPKRVAGQANIDGILQTAKEKSRVTVFLIHGMGLTDNCFYESSAEMLARIKHVIAECEKGKPADTSDTEIIKIRLPEPYTYNWPSRTGSTHESTIEFFGSVYKTRIPKRPNQAGPEIVQYAYYWHEDAWKVQLDAIGCDLPKGRRSDRPAAGCTSKPANRVLINGFLKRAVMNEGFSDATIYASGFGRIMRAGTREALCFAVLDTMRELDDAKNIEINSPCADLEAQLGLGDESAAKTSLSQLLTGSPNLDVQFTILTRSLGSRILFDALGELPSLNDGAEELQLYGEALLRVLLSHTPNIYMSANQLMLLSTTQIEASPSSEYFSTKPVAETTAAEAGSSLLEIYLGGPVKSNSVLEELPEDRFPGGNIIAFSDPNDVLGYRIGDAVGSDFQARFADVEQIEATRWLGLLAWFPSAHDKSFDKPKSRQIVMCGAEIDNEKLKPRKVC